MEQKTKVHAEAGRQDLLISRDFDLPLELLFRAYAEAELVEQWMSTKVVKLECKKHGSYLFETTDPKGNKHVFGGTIHEFVTDSKITRTFEMEGTPFPVQLEFLDFQALDSERSRLTMHVVYKSAEVRDNILRLPFVQGINLAHNRLEKIAGIKK